MREVAQSIALQLLLGRLRPAQDNAAGRRIERNYWQRRRQGSLALAGIVIVGHGARLLGRLTQGKEW